MDTLQVNVNGNITVRGPHLVHLVKDLPRLLDLSLAMVHSCTALATSTTTVPNTTNTLSGSAFAQSLSNTLNSPLSNTLLLKHNSPHTLSSAISPYSSDHQSSLSSSQGPVLQDQHTKGLFALLASSFPSLKRINISGWNFSLDNCSKVAIGVVVVYSYLMT